MPFLIHFLLCNVSLSILLCIVLLLKRISKKIYRPRQPVLYMVCICSGAAPSVCAVPDLPAGSADIRRRKRASKRSAIPDRRLGSGLYSDVIVFCMEHIQDL